MEIRSSVHFLYTCRKSYPLSDDNRYALFKTICNNEIHEVIGDILIANPNALMQAYEAKLFQERSKPIARRFLRCWNIECYITLYAAR